MLTKGQVVSVELPGTGGHEQGGRRPAMVVRDMRAEDGKAQNILLIPFTTAAGARRFAYTLVVDPSTTNGLQHQSVLLGFHMQAVDSRRVGSLLGKLDDTVLRQVDALLSDMLGLG